jgi:hypothetical protein
MSMSRIEAALRTGSGPVTTTEQRSRDEPATHSAVELLCSKTLATAPDQRGPTLNLS